MVRGLALRSLCSLRLPAMVEYISDPLKASLTDANSYVRKTGVMAILKMWHLWPQAVEDGVMVDTLYNMLQDTDAQVGRDAVVCCAVRCGADGMWLDGMEWNVQRCAIWYVLVWYDAVWCGAVRYGAVRCCAVLFGAVRCCAMLWNARLCCYAIPGSRYCRKGPC